MLAGQETFPSLIGDRFSLRNVLSWKPLWSGEDGETKKRHEKILISKDTGIICLGDSNRNDYSVHHAGGTIINIKILKKLLLLRILILKVYEADFRIINKEMIVLNRLISILFCIFIFNNVCLALSCKNIKGQDVAWWIHLADSNGGSLDYQYGRGLYMDSKLDLRPSTSYTFFTDLMKLHTKQGEGPVISPQVCSSKKYLGMEWYHDQAPEKTKIDAGDFYHGHVKALYVYDYTDPDENKYTGFYISHSMRMPHFTLDDGLFNPNDKGELKATQPSQHAFCNSLVGKKNLDKFFDILQNTKAVLVRAKDDCRYFTTTTSMATSPNLQKCDVEWTKHVQQKKFNEGVNVDGETILRRAFNDYKTYEVTKKYCMENGGPFKLGAFTTYSFYARKKNGCNSHGKTTDFYKPTDQLENDNLNYQLYSKCFAERYNDKLRDKSQLPDIDFEMDKIFENVDPTKISKMSTTHCKAVTRYDTSNFVCKKEKTVCSFTDFGVDPYLLVARSYINEGGDFFVSTDQETFPSLIGDRFSLRNVLSWKPLWSGEDGETKKRHEKIMISKEAGIICLGDSNRNDYSVHHAGTIYCLKNNALVDKVHASIGNYNEYRQFYFGSRGRLALKPQLVFENIQPACYLYAMSLYHPIDTDVAEDMKFYKQSAAGPKLQRRYRPGTLSNTKKRENEGELVMHILPPGVRFTRSNAKKLKEEIKNMGIYDQN
ncbi:hypothetical protein PPL_07657 [Heterostelium album PN500]|uniref:Uncharacterized protein n=1 Tax=Heterostelium pallidum (strain ATCC 26659 / Pp 5 / PN500) TaxID=670386 RepID=D3BGK5_HETP5|nr:hypothetical protein PPL_07657 [Heterostelium album PN500]EFA79239.1 hypothetical protein PPL_07657 [Heterostelium album PN500]|eukprot:XP_020431360.1 hypothetical protein PPL_07657 [Heterostelium album PN500]